MRLLCAFVCFVSALCIVLVVMVIAFWSSVMGHHAVGYRRTSMVAFHHLDDERQQLTVRG
jgi:hypothetical protein